MNRLIVLCGIPGSGKSTWAKKYVAEHKNTVVVSRDNIRFSMLSSSDDYFVYEDEVFRTYIQEIEKAWADGKTVIADATHLNHASRAKLIRAFDQEMVKNHLWLEFVNFENNLEVALERNETRTGRAYVPRGVIRRMHHQFEPATIAELPRIIIRITNINIEGEEI